MTRGRTPVPRRGFEASIRFESSGGLRRHYPRGRALGSPSVLRGPVRLSARLSRVRPPRSPTRYAQLLLDPPRPSMPSLPPGHSQPLACAQATPAGLPGLRSAHARIRHGRRRCRLPVPSSRSRRPSRGRAAAHHSILSPRVANRRRVSRPTKRKKDGGTEGRAWRPTKRKLTLLHPCGLRDQVRTSAGT